MRKRNNKYQLVESYRQDGKVKQRVYSLGKYPTIKKAIAGEKKKLEAGANLVKTGMPVNHEAIKKSAELSIKKIKFLEDVVSKRLPSLKDIDTIRKPVREKKKELTEQEKRNEWERGIFEKQVSSILEIQNLWLKYWHYTDTEKNIKKFANEEQLETVITALKRNIGYWTSSLEKLEN